MTPRSLRAFSIIELLVVVAIIGMLMALVMPALSKARDHSKVLTSQSHLRQLQLANFTYGAEHNDRQLTYTYDNLARYGTTYAEAGTNYAYQVNTHKFMIVGTMGPPPVWLLDTGWNSPSNPGTNQWGEGLHVPMQFGSHLGHQGYGTFRYTTFRPINAYFNDRFYNPVFYAPKDSLAMNLVEPLFDREYDFRSGELQIPGQPMQVWFPSYCYSPAAMYNPQVLSRNDATGLYFNDPWTMHTSMKSPTFSQARYSGQKTHMLEHHWLQNRRKEVNPNLPLVPDHHWCPNHYNLQAPYFFNHSKESAPVTAFYDGHIGLVGQMQAIEADARAATQSGGGGLWSRDTPMGVDGYFGAIGFDETRTSYHMLTIDGILGRDIVDGGQ